MSDAPSTINLRPPMWLPIVVVLIGGAFYIAGKNMEIKAPQESPLTISVSADAKVSAAPDVAELSFGITSGRQPTSKAAIEVVRKNMEKIIAATKDLGVKDSDIATERFWLHPVYDYTTSGQVPRGFEAGQSLRVKARDLDKAGDILTAATNAGANQADGVTFKIDEPDALKAQARVKALEKAKQKAKKLADDLGMSLGRLRGFSEDGAYNQPMPMMARSMMGMDASAVMEKSIELPAGEQEIVSNVTLTYELR